MTVLAATGLIAAACGGGDGGNDTATQETTPETTPGASPEWEATVEAAEAEGSLVLYTSTLADPVVAAFEEKYPAINVEIVRLASAELPPKIDAEVASGNVVGDALWITAITWEHDKADAGTHFEELDGPSTELYPADFTYKGAVAPISGDIYGLMYNTTQATKPAEQTWTAFMDAEYKGRVSVLEPSGAAQTSYLKWLSEREGGKYFDELAPLDPVITAASAPNAQAVGSGEIAWSPMVLGAFHQQMLTGGAPVEWYVPEGEAFSITYDAMVMAEAPHKNAAKVFVDFMMSEEGQQAIIDGGHGLSWLAIHNDEAKITGALDRDPDQIKYPLAGADPQNEVKAMYDKLFR